MRVIKERFLKRMAVDFPQAANWINTFLKHARASEWMNLAQLRRTYPQADLVKVKSRNDVVVFNVAGNKYRLIAAIHFNTGKLFTLRFLTHAEYSKDHWKSEL